MRTMHRRFLIGLYAILVCALIILQSITTGTILDQSWRISSATTKSPSLSPSAFLSSMNLSRDDLYERNYFHQAWMTYANKKLNANINININTYSNRTDDYDAQIRRHHPLAPMDALIRYISEHSHQRLELEWNEACHNNNNNNRTTTNNNSTCKLNETTGNHRKYLVASYSCPIESGNRLHRFMNGLMWAVLTNRTFLWRYQTNEVCEEWGEADATTLPYDDPHGNGAIRVVRTGKQVLLNPGDILTVNPLNKTKHIVQHQNLERLRDLRVEGIYFLYGMLFEEIFTMDPSLDPHPMLLRTHHSVVAKAANRSVNRRNDMAAPTATANNHNPTTTTTDTETIFIHSRHTGAFPDDYTWPYHMCLERLFPPNGTTDVASWSSVEAYHHQPRPSRCHIYVMSDRSIAVELLHAEIQNTTRCTSSSTSS